MFTRSTPSLWAVAGAPLAPALLAGCGGNDDGGSTVVTPKSHGELVTTGNGGYSPALSYRDMAYAMKQGYAEMQRYPQHFDGVIAGAPRNNRVRLHIEFMHRFMLNRNRATTAR